MRTPEEIERALAERLIPRGFSEKGGREIEALIDELAGEEESGPVGARRVWWWGAAAAAAMMASIVWWPADPASRQVAGTTPPGDDLELLSESIGVVAAEPDERLRSEVDGQLMQAWHLSVVSEERFLDAETGHEVRVVRPSDELVLVPVSTF